MNGTKSITKRGFKRIDFLDLNAEKCSFQKSSIAGEDCLWLGCESGTHIDGGCFARMHLDKKRAFFIIRYLIKFLLTGDL